MTEQLTIRQMLELAAKAVGYDGLGSWEPSRACLTDYEGFWWEPNEDDGDSQRLAAHLNLSIQPDDTCVEVTAPDCFAVDGVCPWSIAKYADHNGEKSEAWRWAVLQVAAQIGAQMP